MKLHIQKGDLKEVQVDLLVVNLFEGMKKLGGATLAIDTAAGGVILESMVEEGFTGKRGETLRIRRISGVKAKHVLMVGLGKKEDFDEEAVRIAAATSLNEAKAVKAKTVASVLHGAGNGGLSAKTAGKAMAEGIFLANYSYTTHKSKPDESSIEQFDILTTNGSTARLAEAGVAIGETYAHATIVARDLVNSPAGHQSPMELALAAKELVKGQGVKVTLYEQAEIEKFGMGGLLGIAKGSDHPPVLVHMVYKPKGKAKKRIALVGKALTFDTGGYSLKPTSSMDTMKLDMAGAAAVIGAFSVIGDVAPNVEVHGFFGACENMVSGRAIRPGDVVTIMNGKTMEILNTDAEGRVTLADVLTFALRSEPDAIIDLATLTGACVVALGEEITGLMTNNPALGEKVKAAFTSAGENVWELPLEKAYRPLINSDIADYKNDAPRWGGALTAGLLLQEFVDGKPWVHLDIAGPAFAEKNINAYTKKGGTGHAVRTLIELIKSY